MGAKKVNALASGQPDPRFMSSLARGLSVLHAFEGRTSLTVTQAAQLAGLSRSSTARCLYTLEQLRYVAADGQAYRLRPALLPLARAFVCSDPLAMAAQPVVDAIRDRLGESSSLAMLDVLHPSSAVIYVYRAEASRIISVPLLTGSTLPSYCTSMGRVLLASLPSDRLSDYLAGGPFEKRTPKTLTRAADLRAELARVRDQKWALVDGEFEAGLRSIAVPVPRADGPTAAINVGVHAARRDTAWLIETALPELQAAAADLARVV